MVERGDERRRSGRGGVARAVSGLGDAFSQGNAKVLAIGGASAAVVVVGLLVFFLGTDAGRRMLGLAAGGGTRPDSTAVEVTTPTHLEPIPAEPAVDEEYVRLMDEARSLLAKNELDAAEQSARAAWARKPESAEAKGLVDQVVDLKRKAEEARLKGIHDEALARAREFFQKDTIDDLEQADAEVGKALEAVPASPDAKELRGRIAERLDRKREELRAKEERAGTLVAEGRQALGAKEFDIAISRAEAALGIVPGHEGAVSLRDDAARAKEEHAKRAAELALEEERRRQEEERQRKEAEDRKTADEWVKIGVIYLGASEFDKAEEQARRALDLVPDHEPAKVLLTQVLEKRKEAAAPPVAVVGPTFIGVPGEATKPPETGTLSAPSTPPSGTGVDRAEADAVMQALTALDRAMEREDVDALARSLSETAAGLGGAKAAGTRADEVANARAFFELVSDLRVERETRAEDLAARGGDVVARSAFRMSYAVGSVRVTKSYVADYTLVREFGSWRVKGVEIAK